MKYDIPQIVEDLYNQVVIPDQKDWPAYLAGDAQIARSLYTFYFGLRAGYQLANALRDNSFNPYEG